MKKIKQWLKSKTIRYGLLLSAMGVVQVYVVSLNTPILTMVAGLIVVWLRFKTVKPVGEK